MVNSGWSGIESPFHRGELAIQSRLGIQERMDKQGRRMIRDYLPDQLQQFFAQLPYVIVGTVDAIGSPWASILVGEPGFLSAPSDRTLQAVAKPLFGDPLATTLANGIYRFTRHRTAYSLSRSPQWDCYRNSCRRL